MNCHISLHTNIVNQSLLNESEWDFPSLILEGRYIWNALLLQQNCTLHIENAALYTCVRSQQCAPGGSNIRTTMRCPFAVKIIDICGTFCVRVRCWSTQTAQTHSANVMYINLRDAPRAQVPQRWENMYNCERARPHATYY